MPHANRSKRNPSPARNPTPAEVIAAREAAGLTQTEAARKVYSTLRAWQRWETEDPNDSRRMHPAIFELFLIKTGQTDRLAARGAESRPGGTPPST